ncbi:hypothetical protein ACMD2_17061 [Ananas comosus]|uniref:Myb/SANT-like domain-containing protein n=1 Tax=Ananas comosus TaxID=4615 RepID=A0A199US85_ANACO|nr:hypothetical protein ACMD2_17061 [Ananas comosus]
MLGSIYVKFYYKETNVHYICNFDSPTKIANKGYAESSSSMRPSGDGEMKIYVQSEDYGNYALEVNSSNTIEDVLITVLGKWPGALYFNGHRLLETAKSLADYSIEDGSILHLDVFELNLVHIREYHIVNRIRHHPKFSWDHKCHVVIATDAEWNEYIKQNPDARPYRTRAIPYVDLLGILFANTKV